MWTFCTFHTYQNSKFEMLLLVLNYLIFFEPSFVLSEKVRVKRAEIELQTCLDNFNVHKDKIIRTQDSQNMGAKYLNEIDLGSREECLRLCCETEDCDVFVFEEKNSGSCYLFHCGPPEDFKCKFTHHVNYTSGVLSVNRHLPDLESQIKLTKHEQDLTKLRTAESESVMVKSNIPEHKTTSTTTMAAMSSKKLELPSKNYEDVVTDRKCSRFQFECRSTRECIAIYNACDGIPQCADGSDEALELGCPDSVTTAASLAPLAPLANAVPIRYNTNLPQSLNQLTPNHQEMYQQPVPQRESDLIAGPSAPNPNFIRPASDPRLQFEHQPQPLLPQIWPPRQANQIIPQLPQYEDKSSRIFNHKDTGYQVPDGQEISQAQYLDSVNSREYSKMGSYYPENGYRQPPQQENWPSGRAFIPTNQQDVQYEGQGKIAFKPKSVETSKILNENVNPKHVQDQLAHDLKHSKEKMDSKPLKVTKPVHHDLYPDVVAYKLDDANDLEDGVAKTQKGAVLAVSLGLIITFIMAVIIGCRLKMVRRRMRKGGKLYAHDADYLVNGMYL